MFDKSNEVFPIKDECIFLSHCGFSPLYRGALHKVIELAGLQHCHWPSLASMELYNGV